MPEDRIRSRIELDDACRPGGEIDICLRHPRTRSATALADHRDGQDRCVPSSLMRTMTPFCPATGGGQAPSARCQRKIRGLITPPQHQGPIVLVCHATDGFRNGAGAHVGGDIDAGSPEISTLDRCGWIASPHRRCRKQSHSHVRPPYKELIFPTTACWRLIGVTTLCLHKKCAVPELNLHRPEVHLPVPQLSLRWRSARMGAPRQWLGCVVGGGARQSNPVGAELRSPQRILKVCLDFPSVNISVGSAR